MACGTGGGGSVTCSAREGTICSGRRAYPRSPVHERRTDICVNGGIERGFPGKNRSSFRSLCLEEILVERVVEA